MKTTLKNLIGGATLALALAGCVEKPKIINNTPKVSYIQTEWKSPERLGNYFFNPDNILENQRIRYTYEAHSSSYELLTDLDRNGTSDVLERKACGYDGQAQYRCQHAFYVKRGFNISEDITKESIRQSTENNMSPKTEISTVEDEFFESYQ